MPRAAAAVTCRTCSVSHAADKALRRGAPEADQLVSVAMLPAAFRAISPKAVTICSMFSGA